VSVLTLIFTGNERSLLSRVISKVTSGPYAHVAIKILNSTLEAFATCLEGDLYPGVWLHEPDRYDYYQSAVFVNVEIPDLKAAEKMARRLLGAVYGYSDLLNSGIYNLTGVSLPGTGKYAVICSEAVVMILRAGGLNILPGVSADSISPMNLFNAVSRYGFA
jgi:hypothetical protein